MSLQSSAKDQLRTLVSRIERLEEEKAALSVDLREVYAEAKGNGFDVKALRTVIRLRKLDETKRREMARSGMRSFCCGGGGGAPVTDIPGKARIPDLRMAQARATGAERVAVACPNCMQMLEGVVAPRPDIVDIAELLLEAVGP